MTTSDARAKAQPNGEPLDDLQQVFTVAELKRIAARSQEIAMAGFGRLTIVFRGRQHPKLIERTYSEYIDDDLHHAHPSNGT